MNYSHEYFKKKQQKTKEVVKDRVCWNTSKKSKIDTIHEVTLVFTTRVIDISGSANN